MESKAVVRERKSEAVIDDPWLEKFMVIGKIGPLPPKEEVPEEEVERRRLRWDALVERIEELVAQLNMSNVATVSYQLRDLEDLNKGPGLVAKTLMRYQKEAPELTPVFAAAVAVANSKFYMVGKIVSHRIIFFFRNVFIYRLLHPNTDEIMIVAKFYAHLIRQRVVRHAAASELLVVLLKNPSDENVLIARHFVVECGSAIESLTTSYIYRKCIAMNTIAHGGPVAKKILRAAREFGAIIANAKAQGSPAVPPELDLVINKNLCTDITSLFTRAVHPYPDFDTFSSSFFSPRGTFQ